MYRDNSKQHFNSEKGSVDHIEVQAEKEKVGSYMQYNIILLGISESGVWVSIGTVVLVHVWR